MFVDGFDRCSADDVVATLTAIRTFLNQDHAVFVVAADRAALEQALKEKLPQPTPVDIENPYYSSASRAPTRSSTTGSPPPTTRLAPLAVGLQRS